MPVRTRTMVTVSLALVTCLIITTCSAVQYYIKNKYYETIIQQYESAQAPNDLIGRYILAMRVNLCIDYGNETIAWFNNTLAPKDYDLLNTTKLLAEVKYTYWPAYDSSFVDVINDVANRSPYFWMWYYWDAEENEWKLGPVGSDRYKLKPDEIVMWRYEKPKM